MWATNLGQNPLGGSCRGKRVFSVLTGLGPKSTHRLQPRAGTETPTAAEQGGQGCKGAPHLTGVSSEIPPSQLQPRSKMGSPSSFLGWGLPGSGGDRRAGSSTAHVSQREPKCGSLRGFDAEDV